MSVAEKCRQVAKYHCDEVICPNVENWESTSQYPLEAVRGVAKDGLLGLYSPTEYGGVGLSFADGIPVFEELGKGDGLYAFSLSMLSVGLLYIFAHIPNQWWIYYVGALAAGLLETISLSLPLRRAVQISEHA